MNITGEVMRRISVLMEMVPMARVALRYLPV